MAKGRRNYGAGYNADHLLGTLANGDGVYMTNGRTTDDLPDLVEEDVWSLSSPLGTEGGGWHPRNQGERTEPAGRARRWNGHRYVGGLSLTFEGGYDAPPTVLHQYRSMDRGRPASVAAAASAPLNVPVWTRFVRVDSAESLEHEPGGLDRGGRDKEEEDEGDSEWLPPHEYLAREHDRRRSGALATSVLEGVGRTLKGRDMSRVRDAVWNRTGFFG